MCVCWTRPPKWWSPSPSTPSQQPSPGLPPATPCLISLPDFSPMISAFSPSHRFILISLSLPCLSPHPIPHPRPLHRPPPTPRPAPRPLTPPPPPLPLLPPYFINDSFPGHEGRPAWYFAASHHDAVILSCSCLCTSARATVAIANMTKS